jgi:hypothetical protein
LAKLTLLFSSRLKAKAGFVAVALAGALAFIEGLPSSLGFLGWQLDLRFDNMQTGLNPVSWQFAWGYR